MPETDEHLFRLYIFALHIGTYLATTLYYLNREPLRYTMWQAAADKAIKNSSITFIILLMAPLRRVQSFAHDVEVLYKMMPIADVYHYIFHWLFHKLPILRGWHDEYRENAEVVGRLASHPIENIIVNVGAFYVPYMLLGLSDEAYLLCVAYISYKLARTRGCEPIPYFFL